MTTHSAAASAATAQKPPRRRPPPKPASLRRVGTRGESVEAKRLAALVLEVLGGVRTPLDAAGVLGITLARYYVLEGRALEGLLQALEPRPRGPRRSSEREIARLGRELERAGRERQRAEALLRAERRALGLKAPEAPKPKEPGKRRRRPVARALRAAAVLRSGGLEEAGGKEDDAVKA